MTDTNKYNELIVHSENFQKYMKIIIVDKNDKSILEYGLIQDFRVLSNTSEKM